MDEQQNQEQLEQQLKAYSVAKTAGHNPWKIAFFVEFILLLITSASLAYFVLVAEGQSKTSEEKPSLVETNATPTRKVPFSPTIPQASTSSFLDILSTPSAKLTEDWSLYQNETFAFSIKYPNGWIITEKSESPSQEGIADEIVFLPEDERAAKLKWTITIYAPSDSLKIEDLIDKIGNEFGTEKQKEQEKVSIGDYKATLVTTTLSDQSWIEKDVIFKKGEYFFQISNNKLADPTFDLFYQSLKLL